jgi:hypothetical protein
MIFGSPVRQVRPCSLFSAYQASMSIWRQDARVLFRPPSQRRKPVAYLTCSAAKRRMLGVMWLRSALARSLPGSDLELENALLPGQYVTGVIGLEVPVVSRPAAIGIVSPAGDQGAEVVDVIINYESSTAATLEGSS